MPEPPVLTLLAYNHKTKSAQGLSSLTTPVKVLTQWHDSNFKGEFRERMSKLREEYPLDLPPKRANEAENPKPAAKKPRTTSTGAGSESGQTDSLETDLVDVESVTASFPLTHEATLSSNAKIELVITIGQGVFALNKSQETQCLKQGAVLCGYYKGKWETEKVLPKGVNDVPWVLGGSDDMLMMQNKYMSLSDIIKQKRLLTPADAHVSFHILKDKPTTRDPSAFVLEGKPNMFLTFKIAETPTKTEEDSSTPAKVPCVHLAGMLPASRWGESRYVHVAWACKWPAVGQKGLQAVRPMVCAKMALSIPAGKALRLLQPET